MTKRKAAIFKGNDLLCPADGARLSPQWDKEDQEACWDCPKCGEWFCVDGEPAIWGTSVAEKE